ncbi:hypothetical protein EDD90_2768 [Streptomyces sp. Ag109_O5-1]|uniref:hypothetical protein n=1 Tax=Streptomyces sp. Ag109_O5-1 TaxID=1938851 RepID=UPI000F4FBB6A|nr:hypothetical protein [Streptomyces sp. Ag109_O5-1]RPE39751.1 hypothetical protein EDD90_2768 [Streptomyces sp. Ag109_O5-1]
MPHIPDDDFTELVDANIGRVDLVDKAANGLPFLMAKAADGSQAGLMDPAFVRDLIGKTATSEPDPAPAAGDTVTMTGTPGALAQLIQQAGSLKKDADMADAPDLDPTVVLAEPDGDAPGDPNTPGSPAWEAVDAATARKWTSILSRAKSALGVMSDREMLEAASADPDDYDAALDLEDAAYAIDYAISILAPFAVDEQAEVDCGTAEMDAIGKALRAFDPAQLDVIESLSHVAKAGRTLSAANEQAIRHAVASLEKVLASLPPAPESQESGQEVAKKETPMPEGTIAETVETPAAATDPVGKADGDEGKAPMVAVYDSAGRLVGIVDPAEITPISGADAGDDTPTAEDAPDAGDDSAADLDPAPAADAGTPAKDVNKGADTAPADDVTKTTTDTDSDAVLKSSDLAELVKGILDEHSAGQSDLIKTQGEAIVELADLVKGLQGQVKALEEQPAEPGVFAQGAVPPAHLLRGQDRGAAPAELAKATADQLRKQLYSGTAAEQNEAANAMNAAAIAALQAIHQQQR